MLIENLIVGVIAVGILIYLGYVLLYPERL